MASHCLSKYVHTFPFLVNWSFFQSKSWKNSFYHQLFSQSKSKEASAFISKTPWKISLKSGADMSFEELICKLSQELQSDENPILAPLENGKIQ
jgi:hypothetical protein